MTRSGSPAVASSRPSASATATTPRCRLSTNPDRSTSARTSTPPPRAPALEPRGYQGRSAVSGSQQEPRLVGDPPSPFRRHARVDGYRRDHLLFQAVEASGAADTVRQELGGFSRATRDEAVQQLARISAEVLDIDLALAL